MRHARGLIPLAVLSFALGAISCRTEITSSDAQAWKDHYRVEVHELLRIGSEDLSNDAYVFSGIHDLRLDDAGNVYVLDRLEYMIKVFSPTGLFLRAYKLTKGQGPGEFERAGSFDIGPNGDLYVADMMSRRVTAIAQKGEYLGTMTLRTYLGQIIVDFEGRIHTTGGLVDTSDHEVHKYRFPDGEILKAFCPTNELAQWIGRVGANGDICLNPLGNILYSFSIPYDIREFNPKGELIRRFGRKITGWKPPQISQPGLPYSPVITQDIDSFPDGKILHVVLDRRAKPYVFLFDIFDEHGTWLISFDSQEFFKDKSGRMSRIDGQGNVYMEFWEPFPHIRKYRIDFVPVNKSAKDPSSPAEPTVGDR